MLNERTPRPPPLCARLVEQVRRLDGVCMCVLRVCVFLFIHVRGLRTLTVAESGLQSLIVSVREK